MILHHLISVNMVTYYEPLGYFVDAICLFFKAYFNTIQIECIHLECVISLGVANKGEDRTHGDTGGRSTSDGSSEKPQHHSKIDL